MKTITKPFRLWTVLIVICSLLIVTGCSNEKASKDTGEGNSDRLDVTVFVPSFSTEPPKDESPALKAIEDYTDTNISMEWVPNSNIMDKFNITLASGDLPHVMYIPNKTPSFVSAVEDGAFWELGPYLKDYDNLSQANEIVLNNSSVNGKIYGVYRSRELGRNGVIIRKDWLENVGLETPKTIDDFYTMLKAFKEEDPDGDGKDDTYGIVISKYEGSWDIMQTWFGVDRKSVV